MTTNDLTAIERVRAADRIASLDILRGIAIVAILFMNIPGMGSYEYAIDDLRLPSWSTIDAQTRMITATWLTGTQRGLLQLLFGVGIMIMARRALDGTGPVEVADLHFRRNLWLIAFGLFNVFGLMWSGDILFYYGIAATFLFPFRRLSPRAQMAFAALFMAGLLFLHWQGYEKSRTMFAEGPAIVAQVAENPTAASKQDRERAEAYQSAVTVLRKGPMADPETASAATEAYADHHAGFTPYYLAQVDDWVKGLEELFWPSMLECAATMLLGMALYQLGFMQGRSPVSMYWLVLLAGYGIGFALRGSNVIEYLQFEPEARWQMAVRSIGRLAVTLGHVALVHLLLQGRLGRLLLRPFVAAGQMPLTVYLFTSLLMMWVVFAPWGFALWGKLSYAELMVLALMVCVAEVAAANMWLTRFANGPMEWVWKSLSYWRRQPFRRTDSALAVA